MSNAVPHNTTATAVAQRRSLAVGAAALVVCGIAGWLGPAAVLRAYLAAYMFYLGIALGSLVILMAYHLTGGSWGFLIRRPLEAATRTLPLLAVLFLPIAYGVEYLYIWAQPAEVAQSAKLQYQQFYLQPAYFWIRAAVYFAAWILIALMLSRWSREEDQTGRPRLAWKSLKLSAFGAVVYGITIHFASVDWTMSLEPVFHSTIWGPMTAASQLLSAMAFVIVVLRFVGRRQEVAEVSSTKVVNDLGNLLLTLLILWAYMAWCQFMLVWIANMPVDTVWYAPRASAAWKAVITAIAILHFAIPFVLLLMRPVKRNTLVLACVAAWLLFMELAFNYYEVVPNFSGERLAEHWVDFITPLGIGGLWLASFLWQFDKRPVVALNDYNRASALRLRRLDEEEAAHEEEIAYG